MEVSAEFYKHFLPDRDRVALLLCSKRMYQRLFTEGYRLRQMHQNHRCLDATFAEFNPLVETVLAHGGDLLHAWSSWIRGVGRPRDNHNSFWCHAPPQGQAPWWVIALSELLLSCPWSHRYDYDMGELGELGPLRDDGDWWVPETWTLRSEHQWTPLSRTTRRSRSVPSRHARLAPLAG